MPILSYSGDGKYNDVEAEMLEKSRRSKAMKMKNSIWRVHPMFATFSFKLRTFHLLMDVLSSI